MGLSDFISQVAQGKGAEAISREVDRVSGNVGREVDRVAGNIEDAGAYVKREAERGVSNAMKLGKKVDEGIHHVANVGKKYSGAVSGVARKVSDFADMGAMALGGAAAVAGATGVGAPISAGLGAAAGVVKGIGAGADLVADTSGKVSRGLDRAEQMSRVATKNVMGGISRGAETLNRGLDMSELKSGATRSGIERVRKQAGQSFKAQFGGLGTR